jgi:hypothetical protein
MIEWNLTYIIDLVSIVGYTLITLAYVVNNLGSFFYLEINGNEPLVPNKKNISVKCPICGHNHIWYKCPLLHLLGAVCLLYLIVYLTLHEPNAPPIIEPGVSQVSETFNKIDLNRLPDIYTIRQYSYLVSLLRSNLSQSIQDQQFFNDVLQSIRKGVLEESIVDAVWISFIQSNNMHEIDIFIKFCNDSVFNRAMAR